MGYLVAYLMGLATSNSFVDSRFDSDKKIGARRSVSDRADRRRDRANRTRLLPTIHRAVSWWLVVATLVNGRRQLIIRNRSRGGCVDVRFENGCE